MITLLLFLGLGTFIAILIIVIIETRKADKQKTKKEYEEQATMVELDKDQDATTEESDEESIWLPWERASKATIVVAVIIMLSTFVPNLNNMYEKGEQRPQYIVRSDTNFISDFGFSIALFATGLTLLTRAFLPSISFMRGLAIVIGGFFFYCCIIIALNIVFRYPIGGINISGFCGMLTPGLFGLMALRWGFTPKKQPVSDQEQKEKASEEAAETLLTVHHSKGRVICPTCGRSLLGITRTMVGDLGVCSKCKTEFIIGPDVSKEK